MFKICKKIPVNFSKRDARILENSDNIIKIVVSKA